MNKDEIKMVEEMAKIANFSAFDYKQGKVQSKSIYTAMAEALINEGYRKVADDEIVESMKTYERARQETAKEILLVLKDNIVNRIGSKYAVIDLTDIAQLAKEKGIELED